MKNLPVPLLLVVAALPLLLLSSCLLEDGGGSSSAKAGTVYTCDAHSTVAELCIEEPQDPTAQKISKSTCNSVQGSWSDQTVCPSGYRKKCPDGAKTQYFYATGDDAKDCSELVGVLVNASGATPASRR